MGTQIILTRSKYCPKCFQNDAPKIHTPFVVYGGKSNKYLLRFAENYGIRGYSPHIILLVKSVGDVICYDYSCCICNTVKIKLGKDGGSRYIIPDNTFKSDTISLKNWNAWVKTKDLGYRI